LRLSSGRLLSSSNPFLPLPSYPSSVPTLFYPPSCSQSSPRLFFYLTAVPLRACAPTHASALHAPSCATALDVGVWFGLVTSARVVNRPRASPRRMRRGEVVCVRHVSSRECARRACCCAATRGVRQAYWALIGDTKSVTCSSLSIGFHTYGDECK
jgi:hypothetical protein